MYVILVISAILPVINCECERTISMLKLLKTSLRSTMGNDRLNGLALMLIHRDVELNPDAVVEEFSRRLLINLFFFRIARPEVTYAVNIKPF